MKILPPTIQDTVLQARGFGSAPDRALFIM